jgi:type I restriction enzyme S subunit
MNEWKSHILDNVIELRVSNVDKKIHPGKALVFLCNYMDVYSNDYINSSLDFSIGSANSGELHRFLLKNGDVIITKDSETPEDIAVPAVVDEELGNVVCGYHLAILRPKAEFVFGSFLMQLLKLPEIQKCFFQLANGSTRYGLTKGSIESLSITLPPLPQQRKIARILSTVDAVIEQTEAAIAKYQQIKQGLMHDLFTRGIGADGQLRPPREEAPQLYRETEIGWVPKEWEVDVLGKYITHIGQGWSPDCEAEPAAPDEWGVLKTTSVKWGGYNEEENKKLPSHLEPRKRHEIVVGDVLMTRAGPNSRVGVVSYVKRTRPKLMLSDKLYRIFVKDSILPQYLSLALSSNFTQKHLSAFKTGLAESQTNISQEIVKSLFIIICDRKEQEEICLRLDSLETQIEQSQIELKKLQSLKQGLMQDLLTGKVEVSPGPTDLSSIPN